MTGRILFLVVVSLVCLPSMGTAQAVEQCAVHLDLAPRINLVELSDGTQHQFAGGGIRWRCRNNSARFRSDSIAYYERRRRAFFEGAVQFEDSAVTLTSDRAVYFLDDERLEAYGNARLVNRNTGSVLTGPNLTYYRDVPGFRDTVEISANQRPTIEYRSPRDTLGAEPYIIVGNQVRMRGEEQAWASGNVTMDRSDFHATADSSQMRFGANGDGVLIGRAYVEGGDSASFSVSGHEVVFTLVDDAMNWVQARTGAEASSADWRLVADTVEFEIADDLVQSGLAWGDSGRARAASELNTIDADSLAIDTPNQILQEIRAFGGARATSVRDSVDTQSDWVAGDTVVARFDSSASGGRFLFELDANGHAQAFYRVFNFELGSDPDLNYSRGLQIRALFTEDGIDKVDVFGEADGVHLQPVRRRQP